MEIAMKTQLRAGTIATALVVASAGMALAAGAASTAPKDQLSLTSAQEHSIVQSLNKSAKKEAAPAGFKASVGQTVPNTIALHNFPSDAASQVPAVKPYDYAMLQGQLLIVNPQDKKIIDVIKL
jgi:ABC-type sugar transport system substrate-binding protein